MSILEKMLHNTRGALSIMSVVVDVALVVALIPVIKTFIDNATNLTATETVLLSLVTLIIVSDKPAGLSPRIGADILGCEAIRARAWQDLGASCP